MKVSIIYWWIDYITFYESNQSMSKDASRPRLKRRSACLLSHPVTLLEQKPSQANVRPIQQAVSSENIRVKAQHLASKPMSTSGTTDFDNWVLPLKDSDYQNSSTCLSTVWLFIKTYWYIPVVCYRPSFLWHFFSLVAFWHSFFFRELECRSSQRLYSQCCILS